VIGTKLPTNYFTLCVNIKASCYCWEFAGLATVDLMQTSWSYFQNSHASPSSVSKMLSCFNLLLMTLDLGPSSCLSHYCTYGFSRLSMSC